MKTIFMKGLLYIILFLFSQLIAYPMKTSSPVEKIDLKLLEVIRETYYASVENEDFVDSLLTLLETNFGKEPDKFPVLILAYYGGIEAVKSKHAFWPFSKMNHLSSSMEYFEAALQKAPASLEIRFMRFSILHYVPGILGYGDEREEDLNLIYDLLMRENYTEVDHSLQKGIAEFLIKSSRLSQDQAESLRKNFDITI